MERRKFVAVTGLAAAALPIHSMPLRTPSPVPRPPSPQSVKSDAVSDALVALAQARHPGQLSEADLAEIRRSVGFLEQALGALRQVKLSNAQGPSFVGSV